MLVTLKTQGGMGFGSYNPSSPIKFLCALCGEDLEEEMDEEGESTGIVWHPSEVDEGIIRTKMRKLDCPQAGMRARAAIELPNIP